MANHLARAGVHVLRRLLATPNEDTGNDHGDGSSGSAQEDDFLFSLYVCISLFLVLMAGLMSGLTLGLMSLDMVELEVRRRCDGGVCEGRSSFRRPPHPLHQCTQTACMRTGGWRR